MSRLSPCYGSTGKAAGLSELTFAEYRLWSKRWELKPLEFLNYKDPFVFGGIDLCSLLIMK